MKQTAKNYSRGELEEAWSRGGKTMRGASRYLGCDPKTFKKYWESTPVDSPRKLRPSVLSSEQTTLDVGIEIVDSYADPKVQRIVSEYLSAKKTTKDTMVNVIHEIVDKIELTEKEIALKQEKVEQLKKYLKNATL